MNAEKNQSQLRDLRGQSRRLQINNRLKRLVIKNPGEDYVALYWAATNDVEGWKSRRREDFSLDCWIPWPRN